MEEQLQRNRHQNEIQENQNLQGQQHRNQADNAEMFRQIQAQNQRYEQHRADQREARSMEGRLHTLLSRMNRSALTHVPEKTALVSEYKRRFTSRLTDAARLSKQRNKKSRLYQKKANAKMVKDAEEFVQNTSFLVLQHNIKNNQVLCDNEDLTDMAAFMTTEDTKSNAEMTRLYLGENEEQAGQDKKKAMDLMLEKLFTRDLSGLRLDNDKELAKNAGRLEKLSWQMAAFDRLAEKNSYFKNVNYQQKEQIDAKLEQIRSIVHYYQLRKEIINDPVYQSHYNDELSMDFTAAGTEEERGIAKKLLRAYAAGKEMMKKNGVSDRDIQKRGVPVFEDRNEGNSFLAEAQNEIYRKKDLIQGYYRRERPIQRAEKIMSENELRTRRMKEGALSNLKNFEGEMEKREGYEEAPYAPLKVMEYVEELRQIKVEDLKFGSYKEIVDHFRENLGLISRAEQLQYQISKALLNDFRDEKLTNDVIMELRAKAMCLNSFKNTMLVVNHEVVNDEKAARYTDQEWESLIRSRIVCEKVSTHPIVRVLPQNAAEIMEKCKEIVSREEEEKETTIQETYQVILSDDEHPEISEEELQKRKDAYQRNAFIQDYTTQDTENLDGVAGPAESLRVYLEKSKNKRVPLGRLFTAMIKGKPAKEVERLFSLATGTPAEQLAYYKEVLESVEVRDIKGFEGKNMGTFFEGWGKKKFLGIASDGEIRSIAGEIRKLMEKDESLTLPENYQSFQELEEDLEFRYDFACSIQATRMNAISQMPSSKWLHVLSMKEMGSFDAKKVEHINRQLALLPEGDTEEEKARNHTLLRIINTLRIINLENEFKPGEQITFDTDLTEYLGAMEEKHKKAHLAYEALKEEAQKESMQQGYLPVYPEKELEEKKKTDENFEALSDKQWKESGGATYQKVMTEKDAMRIAQKSRGFLVAKKHAKKGLRVLRPTLPETAEIAGQKVAVRKSYNLFLKAYITLMTNEDGSLKSEAAEEGGICEQFDYITSTLFSEDDKAAGKRKAEGYLNTSFLPVFKRILEEKYVMQNASEEEKERAREKAGLEAAEAVKAILAIATNLDDEMFSANEFSMRSQIKNCNRFLDADPQRLREFLSELPIKETVMENGMEVIKERKPTEQEIEKVLSDFRNDTKKLMENLKQIRNMDAFDQEIPIPNTCSGNMRFMNAMHKLILGKAGSSPAHRFSNYVLEHPEKARLYLLKNLELFSDTMNFTETTREMYRETLKKLSFQENEAFKSEADNDKIRALCNIADKYYTFAFHVAANISEDQEDGLITVEGMAATTDQFMEEPFTMSSLIGQYYGENKINQNGELNAEGFSKFNGISVPFLSGPVAAMKSKLKNMLTKEAGIRVQKTNLMVEELKASAVKSKQESAEGNQRSGWQRMFPSFKINRGNLRDLKPEEIAILKQYETDSSEETKDAVKEILDHTGLNMDTVLFKEADMHWLLGVLHMDNPDIEGDLENEDVKRLIEESVGRLNENPPTLVEEEITTANLAFGESHTNAPVNLIINAYSGTKALCVENIDGSGGNGSYPMLLQKGTKMRVLKVEPHEGGGNTKWDVYMEIIGTTAA